MVLDRQKWFIYPIDSWPLENIAIYPKVGIKREKYWNKESELDDLKIQNEQCSKPATLFLSTAWLIGISIVDSDNMYSILCRTINPLSDIIINSGFEQCSNPATWSQSTGSQKLVMRWRSPRGEAFEEHRPRGGCRKSIIIYYSFTYVFIYLSLYVCIYSCVYLSIYLCICLSIYSWFY